MSQSKTVLVTGADRGLGLALCAGLLEQGWMVFAGQYLPDWPELGALAEKHHGKLHILPLDVSSSESVKQAAQQAARLTSHLDLLISNAGITHPNMMRTIREEQDYDGILQMYNVNAVGALRVMEAFLPLLDQGSLKRLCFVSSEAGSIARSYRTSWFGYCMSKSALNMAVSILFNDLRPAGYTFRVYHPGWVRSYMSG
ncbi:MAG: SDR family NAD(P)-dependent oxidoreductase, partial [Anaerolineaceae bacterium]|nr:SDR family NAD(P)-dependent oxidoreductase [Anaerolineaceae bacterium]